MRRSFIVAAALALVLSGCGVTSKPAGAGHGIPPGPIAPSHTITASLVSGPTSALKPMAVDPVSESLLYALATSSSGTTSLTSHNGGQTWVPSGHFQGSNPAGLQYVNAEDGFAFGLHSLWPTHSERSGSRRHRGLEETGPLASSVGRHLRWPATDLSMLKPNPAWE